MEQLRSKLPGSLRSNTTAAALLILNVPPGRASRLREESRRSLRSCLVPRREARLGTRHFTCRLVRQACGLPSAPQVSAAIMCKEK